MKSYGIILYYVDDNNKKKFLIYQRRDSHAFITILRNSHKYSESELLKISDDLTLDEKERLKNHNFEQLWDDLILNKKSKIYTTERRRASSNFYKLKNNGVLQKIIDNPHTGELLWGFPKGRQNKNETNKQTAIREFKEETCMKTSDIKLYDKLLYVRINDYLTTFYIGKTDNEIPILYKDINEIRKQCVSSETNDLKWIYADERDEYLDKSLSRFIYYIDTEFT